MKTLAIIFLLLLRFSAFSQQWEEIAPFPGNKRDDGTTFRIGNKVYCGLGMNAWFGCNSDFKVFDLDAETWTSGVDIPAGEERQYANGFSYNDMGYVFGGINPSGEYLNDLLKFDPVTGAWTAQAALPAPGRSGAVCFMIADTVYIAGGKTATVQALNEVWAYDLGSDTWSQRGDLPFDGIWKGVSFAWNGSGMVGLGKDNQGALNDFFYRYSPGDDTWEEITAITLEGTSYTAAAQIGDMAFLYGGMNASGAYLNTFTKLDLNTFEAMELAPFPAAARRGGMAFAGDHTFYLTTGVSSVSRLDETWRALSVLSLEENATAAVKITLFPNPSTGEITVSSPQLIRKIAVLDLQGKEIYRQEGQSGYVTFNPPLSQGIYLLRVDTASGQSLVKIVRE